LFIIIIYFNHKGRRPGVPTPQASRRRSDSPSSRGMSLISLSIIIYPNYTRQTSWSLDAPMNRYKSYMPMNKSSREDINEHGSTLAKYRKRRQYKEEGVEISGRPELSGQDTSRLRAKNEDTISWERYQIYIPSSPPLITPHTMTVSHFELPYCSLGEEYCYDSILPSNYSPAARSA
jgi:hypothetical protein